MTTVGGSTLTVLNSNVSGMNRFLLDGLRSVGWSLQVLDVPYPRDLWIRSALRGFHLRLPRWKERTARLFDRAEGSSETFLRRTAWCERALARGGSSPTALLQISGMFAVGRKPPAIPYAVFLSWTRALSEREYPAWVPDLPADDLGRWRELEGELYRGAARLFVTNDYVRRSLTEDYGVSAGRIVTTGYGVPFTAPPSGERADDGRTLLFVGYDFVRKGGPTLLEAFRDVRRRVPGVRLQIAGSHPPSQDEEGVEFLGPIRDRAALGALYRQATLFVLPTLCEPFGLVFLEAMAHGVPCVASGVDALPEIVPPDAGWLVPPRDPRALADRLIAILEDPALHRAAGRRARAWVEERFTWTRVAETIDRELHLLLGRPAPAAPGRIGESGASPLPALGLPERSVR